MNCIYSFNSYHLIEEVRNFSLKFLAPILILSCSFGLQSQDVESDSLLDVSPIDLGIDSALLYSKIDSIMVRAISESAFPGAQLLIAQHGKVFYHQSFGYHTYDSLIKVDNLQLYDLASITKIVASTLALMKLYEEGKFDPDETLSFYFPYLKRSNKADIIMRKVLAHQSRLRNWIPYYEESQKRNGNYKRNTICEDSSSRYPHRIPGSDLFLHEKFFENKVIKMIRQSELYNEEGYVYSGLIFYLIPELVERLSGMTFSNFLGAHFYEPMRANTLGFEPKKGFQLDEIVPTEVDTFFRMNLLHGVVHDEGAAVMQGVSGNAGLFSNSMDLAKILQMLLNGGKYAGVEYLHEKTIEEFTRCQYCEVGNRRGLGFDKPLIEYDSKKSSVAKAAGASSYGHSGYTGTLVWMDPEAGLLFIFLSNRVYPSRINKKIYELNVRPDVHTAIYDLIKNKNPE